MKVLHICLSCFYIDDHSYQENILVREHLSQGHEVEVLASTETFNKQKKVDYVKPSTYMGSDGAKVTRVPYLKWLPKTLAKKLRIHKNIYAHISQFSPDVIVFHGMCGWELLTVLKYQKQNPNVTVWADSHEDFVNSARGFISKHFLHGLYYRPIAKYFAKQTNNKILCVSISVIQFLRDFYRIPEGKLEFYPLGGKIFNDEEYLGRRLRKRLDLGLEDDETLIVQTGKQTNRKKLLKSLESFNKLDNPKLKFVIAGLIESSDDEKIHQIIAENPHVSFIGWCSTEEVDSLLCAADIYLQPGTQSATMQNSLCKRCAVILDDIDSHQPYVKRNGWLINSDQTLDKILNEVSLDSEKVANMSEESFKLASDLLDYEKLAFKLLAK